MYFYEQWEFYIEATGVVWGSSHRLPNVTLLSFIKGRFKEYVVISDESVPVSVPGPHLDLN